MSTTIPPPPAHERRRARLSEQFLGVVEEMLEAGESYADVSVERLIRAVDISRSTFYVYFQDKGELLSAMAERVTAELAEAGSSWFQLPPDGTKDDLRDSLRILFDTYRRHRHILGAVSEAAAYDARLRERHRLLVEAAVTGLTDHIERAQRSGSAAPELDARRTAEWLTWMHERGLYQLVGPAGAAEREQLLAAMTDLAWRVLYEGYRSP
jgi:TetR/AcrR family transcriptional regulator, ethionamide resistance regulator